MTATLVAVYLVGLLTEVGGVLLLVLEVRDSRRAWDSFDVDRGAEQDARAADPLVALDPFETQYGTTPVQVGRTVAAVGSLVRVRRLRQTSAIGLVIVGIVISFVGNILSVLS
ncbi:hypothetical protein ABN028_23530 [Actinopolymorpha sp. B17G11]|uniref:hypothetical protein n=1 Tax=Actinopolymorpha sp. B17G11 TaxID=3160861 RepID=UPI0032E49948